VGKSTLRMLRRERWEWTCWALTRLGRVFVRCWRGRGKGGRNGKEEDDFLRAEVTLWRIQTNHGQRSTRHVGGLSRSSRIAYNLAWPNGAKGYPTTPLRCQLVFPLVSFVHCGDGVESGVLAICDVRRANICLVCLLSSFLLPLLFFLLLTNPSQANQVHLRTPPLIQAVISRHGPTLNRTPRT